VARRPERRAAGAVALLLVLTACGGGGDAGRAAAERFDAKARAAFASIAQQEPTTATDIEKWSRRDLDAAAVTAELATTSAAYAASLTAVRALPVSPRGAIVNALLAQSVVVGQVWLDVTAAAVGAPSGPFADQLVLAGRRLRELADRIFDRGHSLLGVPETAPAGVEIIRPDDVPSWTAEGLAAGPPLDTTPPAPSDRPSVRAATRPRQSRAAWTGARQRIAAPSAAVVSQAVARPDADALRALAGRLADAAAALWRQPDPDGNRELSARTALSYLVLGESARLAEAAALAGPGPLADRLRANATALLPSP
jgi:hypothetical protein